jgi:histidine ammonia-lyase
MLTEGDLAALEIDGSSLSIEDVVRVARRGQPVRELVPGSPACRAMQASADWVRDAVRENAERASRGQPATAYYGINVGFGKHAEKSAPFSDEALTRQLSRKLIISHSIGVGPYLDEDVVRAAMLIRANTLAKGRSGARPEIVNLLVEMLKRGVYPAIPSIGSVGASGDLAPLSHLALVMSRPPEDMQAQDEAPGFGAVSGEAFVPARDVEGRLIGYRLVSGREAMTWDGEDRRLVLHAKEGLALNNGTAFSAAIAALALHDAENLIRNAEIALAFSLEALQGYRDAFLPQVHRERGHPGQIATAANVYAMVKGSQLLDRGDFDRNPDNQPPQDAYSLRCAPQVIGAAHDALAHIHETLAREINAATDNPLIFCRADDGLARDDKVISGGNFHGEHIAVAMDLLSIVMTEVGNISERRVFRLTSDHLSRDLPSALAKADQQHYINSGLMLAQYIAAALVSKCKTLSHPDSVDSIPTGADLEDHVSMSMNAALHAREVVENITRVIAIECLAAVQAVRHRFEGRLYRRSHLRQASEDSLGRGTRAAFEALREHAPQVFEWPLDRDVINYPYLRKMIEVVRSGALVEAVLHAGVPLADVRAASQVVSFEPPR